MLGLALNTCDGPTNGYPRADRARSRELILAADGVVRHRRSAGGRAAERLPGRPLLVSRLIHLADILAVRVMPFRRAHRQRPAYRGRRGRRPLARRGAPRRPRLHRHQDRVLEGHCGACTVPSTACRPLVHHANRGTPSTASEITTIEGLRDHPTPIDAFVRADAVQCGFCTPGRSSLPPRSSMDSGAVRDEVSTRWAATSAVAAPTPK